MVEDAQSTRDYYFSILRYEGRSPQILILGEAFLRLAIINFGLSRRLSLCIDLVYQVQRR